MQKVNFVYLILLLLITISNDMHSQWSSDPTVNLLICDEANDQSSPHFASDGNGGVIIAWWDNRNVATTSDIYIQRVNANGTVLWTEGGIATCTASGQQTHPRVISDGTGSAVIIWRDYRNGSTSVTMYGQRVDADGNLLWTANGIQLSNTTNHKRWPMATTDGTGGAILTWEEQATAGAQYDVRAQRVNSSGAVQWGANGVLVYDDQSSQHTQEFPHIAADGSGGCIITWVDKRTDNIYYAYAQRLNSAGTLQWGADGIKLCTDASTFQDRPFVICDGSANSIISWYDLRSGSDANIYAQKLNSSGARQWTNNSILVSAATNIQLHPQVVSDEAGGAIITWSDYRNGSDYDIYAQRVSSAGTNLWTANGVAICTETAEQIINEYKYEAIVSDGAGGAIINWPDKRSSTLPDIYAQRINSAGVVQWTANGLAVCTAARGQWNPALLTDGNSGAFSIWSDNRITSSSTEVYMQKISSGGTLPVELTSFTANIADGTINLTWQTATEINNYGFEIHRAPVIPNEDKNLSGLSEVWEILTFIEGHGNSNSPKNYSFTDTPTGGTAFKYRLKQIDFDGAFEYSDEIEISFDTPAGFELKQNFPNPFNPSTAIKFSLPVNSKVTIAIYDLLGREMIRLIDEEKSAGSHIVYWDGLNKYGEKAASGIYIYTISADNFYRSRKMSLMK